MAFSPDVRAVVTWNAGPVVLWRLGFGAQPLPPADRMVNNRFSTAELPAAGAVVFSPDGRTMLTSNSDSAHLYDLRTVQPVGAPLQHPKAVQAVAISPDGRTIATGSEDTARLWEAAQRESVVEWKMPDMHLDGSGNDRTAVSPDGKKALTVGRDDGRYAVQLWNVATSKPLGHSVKVDDFTRYTSHVATAFSPDGETAAVVISSQTSRLLWLWRAGAWSSAKLPPGEWISAVALGPEGRTALLDNKGGTAQLWEVGTWKPLGPPLPHQVRVEVVAMSPDGRIALTGGGSEARLWEATTGKPLGPPLAHQGMIRAAAFSPDGRTVLTGGDDNTARLWEVATGHQVGGALMHSDKVNVLAFSPDGRTIVTADFPPTLPVACGIIHFWDVSTGKLLCPPFRPPRIRSVMFAPDGRTVLVGGIFTVWSVKAPAAPLEEAIGRLVLTTQLSTSRDLDTAGVAGWQTMATWQRRKGDQRKE
jgi:WD40 repeat protein